MTIQERIEEIERKIDEACEKNWTKEYCRLFAKHEELVWLGAKEGFDKEAPRDPFI